jgi:hypothetical protein
LYSFTAFTARTGGAVGIANANAAQPTGSPIASVKGKVAIAAARNFFFCGFLNAATGMARGAASSAAGRRMGDITTAALVFSLL